MGIADTVHQETFLASLLMTYSSGVLNVYLPSNMTRQFVEDVKPLVDLTNAHSLFNYLGFSGSTHGIKVNMTRVSPEQARISLSVMSTDKGTKGKIEQIVWSFGKELTQLDSRETHF